MKSYASFCPIAKASEILTERWTLLVLRDMLQGSHHFSELRRGVPMMSPTLLSKRLQTLEEVGLISRQTGSNGHATYHPTDAARELSTVIDTVGHWGQRWVRSRLTRDELDPGSLMWFMHRHFVLDRVPASGLVLFVEITDVKKQNRWWFVVTKNGADLCWDDPGREIDITLSADLLTLTQIFMGDLSLARAQASDRITLDGPQDLVDAMPNWFPRSKFGDDNPIPEEG